MLFPCLHLSKVPNNLQLIRIVYVLHADIYIQTFKEADPHLNCNHGNMSSGTFLCVYIWYVHRSMFTK